MAQQASDGPASRRAEPRSVAARVSRASSGLAGVASPSRERFFKHQRADAMRRRTCQAQTSLRLERFRSARASAGLSWACRVGHSLCEHQVRRVPRAGCSGWRRPREVLLPLPLVPPSVRCALSRRLRDAPEPFDLRMARVKHLRFAPGLCWPCARARSAAAFQTEFDTTARQKRSSGTAQSALVVRTCKREHWNAS
jgi:hypothetical protein